MEEAVVVRDPSPRTFTLYLKDLEVGQLTHTDNHWRFVYCDAFKAQSERYHAIVGFPDLNRTYQSETLWPFFLIRIPGLKQPAIKEILEKEQIHPGDEVTLLKRFGLHSLANPFLLKPQF